MKSEAVCLVIQNKYLFVSKTTNNKDHRTNCVHFVYVVVYVPELPVQPHGTSLHKVMKETGRTVWALLFSHFTAHNPQGTEAISCHPDCHLTQPAMRDHNW